MIASKVQPSAKRKKTADMHDSPPKRLTRSRAKATDNVTQNAKTTRVLTAAAKAASVGKDSITNGKVTKRKTRSDDEKDQPVHDVEVAEQPSAEPIKSQGRPSKPVQELRGLSVATDATVRSKSRQCKATVASEGAKLEGSKPRGRPRKAADTAPSNEAHTHTENEKPQPAKKISRARATTVTTKPVTSTISKTTGAKKRVTFKDQLEKDKENFPIGSDSKTKSLEFTGLRAKPIRKPAAAKGSTRAKKASKEETVNNDQNVEKEAGHPLSPKKVKQVAKTSSVSSDDELSGEKTPMKALSKSPTKPPLSVIRDSGRAVSKINFSPAVMPTSPTRPMSSSILGSPARRPPPSPFKDALKDTPKRINLGEPLVQPALTSSQSPFKASLLQTPARRPAGPPMKSAFLGSPGKSGMAAPMVDTATASKQINVYKVPELSSQNVIRCPLRGVTSPTKSVKVHKITTLEQQTPMSTKKPSFTVPGRDGLGSKDQERPLLVSELQETPKTLAVPLESSPSSPSETAEPAQDDSKKRDSIDFTSNLVNSVGSTRSTTPPGPPPSSAAKAFSLASPILRCTFEDSDSEDEMVSVRHQTADDTIFHSDPGALVVDFATPEPLIPTAVGGTPKGTHGNGSICNDKTISSAARAGSLRRAEAVSMTPLAMQLSSWLAASPEKKTPGSRRERGRGIFSSAGQVDLGKPEQAVDDIGVESPVKSTFFDDEIAILDREAVSIVEEEQHEAVEDDRMSFQASQESLASEEYGDENAVPIEPESINLHQGGSDLTLTCTPAKVFSQQPREIHTVSKVPLRPAAEDSPVKIQRKRSKSLADSALSIGSCRRPDIGRNSTVISSSHDTSASDAELLREPPVGKFGALNELEFDLLQTPTAARMSIPGSIRSARQGVESKVLKGAVVYVDVHTTEGADASGLFVELLTQMGARCVKQWLWNPRASVTSHDDISIPQGESPEGPLPVGKVGITHVVFKDGGKRTLEKIRESKGVVLCIGVGWVLE